MEDSQGCPAEKFAAAIASAIATATRVSRVSGFSALISGTGLGFRNLGTNEEGQIKESVSKSVRVRALPRVQVQWLSATSGD